MNNKRYVFVFLGADTISPYVWGRTRSGKRFDYYGVSEASMMRLARACNDLRMQGAYVNLSFQGWYVSER